MRCFIFGIEWFEFLNLYRKLTDLEVVPPQDCMTQTVQLPDWPFAYGGPSGQGKIRSYPDDFIVHEQLGFEPSGSGEHVFLYIEKTGENTEYVARALARFAEVRQRDIGYAGLKDRHARTRQWFSVWLPSKSDPNWQEFETDDIKVLSAERHNKKLKRGVLVGNDFNLTVREWNGDKDQTIAIFEAIKEQGLPNYFGEQRFGFQGQNINQALALFQGAKVKRQQRSLYLSAARSFLFNEVLAERVKQKNWNQYLAGDALMFDRSRSYFKTETMDQELRARVNDYNVHPSGMLYGFGQLDVKDEAHSIEQAVCKKYPKLVEGLIKAKVELARRPLRIMVENLNWQFAEPNCLTLAFSLPAGSYATTLLREIITQD